MNDMEMIDLWQEESGASVTGIEEQDFSIIAKNSTVPSQVTLVMIEEDNHDTMYPFSVLHTQWELRTGRYTVIEAWKEFLKPLSYKFYGRTLNINSFLARYPEYNSQQLSLGKVVVLSPRLLPTKALSRQVLSLLTESNSDYMLTYLNEVVGIVCNSGTWELIPQSWTGIRHSEVSLMFKQIEIEAQLINSISDVLDCIETSLRDSIPENQEPVNEHDFRNAGVFIVNPNNIFIGESAEIAPMVVLDASKGPIIIDNNVTIMSQSTLQGPCYIGNNSLIKIGAKIYHNTVIGNNCKVGGEIEHSVIQGYSNKQHEGFLGHSFLSEWVNLGADTNTSDLKNTYGNINITQRGKTILTQRMFLGLICGDHSKSGINTMFNTGTVCGIHANVFGAGYTPAELHSFTWGGIGSIRKYTLKMALKVAQTVMQRRGKVLLHEEVLLMNVEFERLNIL